MIVSICKKCPNKKDFCPFMLYLSHKTSSRNLSWKTFFLMANLRNQGSRVKSDTWVGSRCFHSLTSTRKTTAKRQTACILCIGQCQFFFRKFRSRPLGTSKICVSPPIYPRNFLFVLLKPTIDAEQV